MERQGAGTAAVGPNIQKTKWGSKNSPHGLTVAKDKDSRVSP